MQNRANIAPSILSADLTNLASQLNTLARADLEVLKYWHIDVMDGHFVPNLTFGPGLIKQLKNVTNIPLDVHLMIDNPLVQLQWYIDAGSDAITAHYEALANGDGGVNSDNGSKGSGNSKDEVIEIISKIKRAGKLAGISIKPKTDIGVLEEYLANLDMVLVMSVEPGFGGQSFMSSALEKLTWLAQQKQKYGYNYEISVDGGINAQTAKLALDAGAELLVAGNAIFASDNPLQAALSLTE